MDVPMMNLEEERQDDEKNRCVNKLLDICLSLTEQVIRLKEMIYEKFDRDNSKSKSRKNKGSMMMWRNLRAKKKT